MKGKLAIFDLDGTLFDTSEVNYHAYKDALEQYGYELDHDLFVNEFNGMHYKTFLPRIMQETGDMEAVHDAKKAAYGKNLDKARENIHLINIAKALKEEYHLAIVTTASKKNTYEILDYFGYTGLFDLILTAEDIKKVKPDPEGFLMAMAYFGTDSEATVIFEDSEAGIKAGCATEAGVMVVKSF